MGMPSTVTGVVAVTPSGTSISMSTTAAAAAAQATANAAPGHLFSRSIDKLVAAALDGCVVGAVALLFCRVSKLDVHGFQGWICSRLCK